MDIKLTYLIKTSLLITYFKTNNCKGRKLRLEQILQTKQWIEDPAVNAHTVKIQFIKRPGQLLIKFFGNWQEDTD